MIDESHDISLCTHDDDCKCPCDGCRSIVESNKINNPYYFYDGTPVSVYEKFEGEFNANT